MSVKKVVKKAKRKTINTVRKARSKTVKAVKVTVNTAKQVKKDADTLVAIVTADTDHPFFADD